MLSPLLWVGCASVLSGPGQTIEINSNIPGVGVYDQGQYLGVTPLRVVIPRQAKKELNFERKGFVTRVVSLKVSTNGNVWWNLPFTILGLTGFSTDYGSGAVYEYSPHKIYVSMKSVKAIDQSNDAVDFVFLNQEVLKKEKARHQVGEFSRTEGYLQKDKN